MVIQENMSIEEKLSILSDAAKYDVACTSSGVDRKGNSDGIGSAAACGICHTFSQDGRCVSLLKILFTNECIFDCKYCVNRKSNDVKRASFTPQEVCDLTMEFYRRNYIEGLFLSSGILVSPDYTMELIYKTLILLRYQYKFNGYIHVKAIPGADPNLINKAGWLADRMSINLELPTSEGLKELAPHKNRKNILKPMKQIQLGIHENKGKSLPLNGQSGIIGLDGNILSSSVSTISKPSMLMDGVDQNYDNPLALVNRKQNFTKKTKFVPAGQSTQMIIGATPETDYQILSVTDSLYKKFDLKRVFYSAYVPINEDKLLPSLEAKPPLLREHRLYQADWLLRFYGFEANEILNDENPYFNVLLDPKCNWALKHLEQFPVEINHADYYTLLRVPGIGVNSARRIVRARKMAMLTFDDLKKIGVVLKRALYFITCGGKMMYPVKIEEDYITRQMLEVKEKLPEQLKEVNTYKQLSLFDTNYQWNIQ
ncbi:MAG: putative DNA modification/repair radical SAM protein [bacterium]|nr:putative DNA modification/repair radical SAM protein [bacterium]